jgi:hypothetical protein
VIARTNIFDSAACRGVFAIGAYTLLSIAFFARGLFGGFSSAYLGQNTTDPSAFMWFLDWWPYAISHRLNPMFTNLLWAPDGTTLAWSTPIPLLAIAAWPITHLFGPVAAYNVLCLAAPVLAGFSAYLLCRWITEEFWPSLLGGFIFGFSPYMLGQILAHLDLVMVFPVPLAVLIALKYHSEEAGPFTYAVGLAGLLIAQFLCFPELLATMTLFAGFAFVIALLVIPQRERIVAMIVPTAAAYALAALVLSPYLYEMLARRSPGHGIYPLELYSADFANFVIPTAANLTGLVPAAKTISSKFTGLIYENGACLTIPLIVIAEAWHRRHWNEPAARLLILMLVAACVAALGPDLHVLGHQTIPMPWALVDHLPFLAIALPVRYSLYAFLALAIIAALWFAQTSARRAAKIAAAASVVVFLLPNPSAGFWVSSVDTPAMFRDGRWRQYIDPGGIIMPLPYARYGNSMLWQATAQMSFRMASGYTSVTPLQFNRLPIVNYLSGAIDLPEAAEHLKAFIASKHVSMIVAAIDDPNFAMWQKLLDDLGINPVNSGGVLMYPIPQGSFANYAKPSAVQLEKRAVALRFDTLLEACARYVKLGKPLDDLTPLALKRAGLLPADWLVSTDPLALHDYLVLPVHGRVGIAIGGTYGALRPLAERYRTRAARIDYPYPRAWSADRKYPNGDSLKPMVFEFDPHALAAAAAALSASPPSERTTPFLDATRSADEVNHE